ncbi:MAG: hypothetical protein GTO02_01855 [Candidatus Dadabacteria bacterium]|nr:hypothetical protein [Candidatus Dadabacteria bacterium]NIQ13182.1 hypothetical protein [Candidatus Dadabacteria bacterium]
MNKENGFTATQTNDGFHVISHNSKKEFDISINEINEFANKYSQETFQGKNPTLSEREEIIFSIWEMVLIPDTTIH